MEVIAGTILADRYVIVRVITQGGMGCVYEARDRRLAHTPCAVKRLLLEHCEDPAASLVRRKFADETAFLATLDHPGIPRIRDSFEEDGESYIVMELVRGETLETILERAREKGELPCALLVVDTAVAVLDVLSYLHEHNPPVLHRDIKPANLIRENDGRVRLIDFGIARLLDATSTATQTQLATLFYAPLEQVQGRADTRSDLYALGATMHHLLSGKMPRPLSLPPLQRVAPHVDADLAAIVNRATATDSIDRFESARQMRESLLAWRQEHRASSLLAPESPRPDADASKVTDTHHEEPTQGVEEEPHRLPSTHVAPVRQVINPGGMRQRAVGAAVLALCLAALTLPHFLAGDVGFPRTAETPRRATPLAVSIRVSPSPQVVATPSLDTASLDTAESVPPAPRFDARHSPDREASARPSPRSTPSATETIVDVPPPPLPSPQVSVAAPAPPRPATTPAHARERNPGLAAQPALPFPSSPPLPPVSIPNNLKPPPGWTFSQDARPLRPRRPGDEQGPGPRPGPPDARETTMVNPNFPGSMLAITVFPFGARDLELVVERERRRLGTLWNRVAREGAGPRFRLYAPNREGALEFLAPPGANRIYELRVEVPASQKSSLPSLLGLIEGVVQQQ